MTGLFAPWHLLVLLGLLIVFFGYRRLPDATRQLGRSMRIFRKEIRTPEDD